MHSSDSCFIMVLRDDCAVGGTDSTRFHGGEMFYCVAHYAVFIQLANKRHLRPL